MSDAALPNIRKYERWALSRNALRRFSKNSLSYQFTANRIFMPSRVVKSHDQAIDEPIARSLSSDHRSSRTQRRRLGTTQPTVGPHARPDADTTGNVVAPLRNASSWSRR